MWGNSTGDNLLISKINKFLYKRQFGYKFSPIQNWRGGGGAKRLPTSFSPVISTNIGTSLKNLLKFSFNPFATLL